VLAYNGGPPKRDMKLNDKNRGQCVEFHRLDLRLRTKGAHFRLYRNALFVGDMFDADDYAYNITFYSKNPFK
jgi:hypothetical protein